MRTSSLTLSLLLEKRYIALPEIHGNGLSGRAQDSSVLELVSVWSLSLPKAVDLTGGPE